ncbi:sugar phosphate isomerase/epimerase family protein [Oscillibacter sp.]|uniref:sugar phosphate isomerase/epimerase family protein n=1 Tax=Oscillibacter sp. TaxID=1945593 RepID=UPI002D7F5506|nr:sugar phosphate isomerase/epimerase family protein [Oscillibacter sp.]
MRFGCCISCAELPAAEKLGFDYVEFSGAEIASLSEDAFCQTAGRVRAGRIPCLSLNRYCDAEPSIVGERFDEARIQAYAKRLCARAAALGVRTIGVGSPKARRLPPGFDRELADRQCLRFLARTAEAAEPYGIQIALEQLNPHACEYGVSTAKVLELICGAGRANLGLVVDFYHRSLAGEEVCDFRGFESRILHTHISGCGPHLERSYPAMEALDYYRALLDALKQVGYDKTMSVEAQTEDFLKQGAETLRMLRLADQGRGGAL